MNEALLASKIRIVLVDTQDGANIGSVCRAMKTMGLNQLVLVTNRVYDENRVRTLALHASDLYENRVEFKTLEEALENSALTVAATRRKGKFRKTSFVSPEQLADLISDFGDGQISIVFGRESDGLTDEEVNKCNMVVTIPTSEAFPSLNLAQSVQIICYVLYTKLKDFKTQKAVVNQDKVQESTARIIEALDKTGYFKVEDERKLTTLFVRDMVSRSAPTASELSKIEKLFVKMSNIIIHKEH